MSQFYFGHSDDSESDLENNDTSLPFPKPLSRSSFLAPSFDPATFLSSLSSRHQTLEDLRLELRDLSHSLNKELLDLVNYNYPDFLSLGAALKGGEEKVEDVRVGLLGFQKDVWTIREKVAGREEEVNALLITKKNLVDQEEKGRTLLEISERLDELESSLMLDGKNGSEDGLDEDEDEDDSDSEVKDRDDRMSANNDAKGSASLSFGMVRRHIQQYMLLKSLANHVGSHHPFLGQQEQRMLRIRTTLLLDLGTAVKEAKAPPKPDHEKLLRLLRLYDKMSEGADALAVLRE